MGTFYGLRGDLDIHRVAAVTRAVLDEVFPETFIVTGPSDEDPGISISIAETGEPFAHWSKWPMPGPTFIGGRLPFGFGEVGYWMLFTLTYKVAKHLHCQVWDDAIGYHRQSEVDRGMEPTFSAYCKATYGSLYYYFLRIMGGTSKPLRKWIR